MNFNDFMNYNLIKKGYSNITEVPEEEIISTIQNFFELTIGKKEPSHDINLLFKEYALTVKNKEMDLAIIIHYLLGYISILQSFQVAWYIEDVEEPTIIFSEQYPNLIDGLKTKEQIDYEKTFELVLNAALDLKEKKEEGRMR